MHAERDIVMANRSVCRSVCLSVTLWYCIETNAYIVKFLPAAMRNAHYKYTTTTTTTTTTTITILLLLVAWL